ncbi:hypothetical protein TrST_g280 [Triparma strigata]|uniref:Methyltransferase type 11 domain-containing protein n=1 Tax=Triparma strigata TaxID=1606541 RepID=A0A9W7E0M3_9STRA|nr:hypothetical protein TrST_g280 [Triparma strigata]
MTEAATKALHDDNMTTSGGETVGDGTAMGSLTSGGTGQGVSFMERLRRDHVRVHPYGEPTYWDERYENFRREHGQNYSFDWYLDPKKISTILELHIGEDRGKKILILGCGNSMMSKVLYDMGYRSIVSVDTSGVVISQMQFRYKDCEGLEFMVGDAMKLDSFPDKTFDAVVEKGCLDCIFCSYNTIDNALLAYQEAWRLLKPGKGKFISLSYGTYETRAAHMKHSKWEVEINPVAYSHGISMFVATKFPEATKKGKMKALLKYGALMGRNTSKDKWKPQESNKHSTQTRHKDKVAQLALQGIVLLTEEEEKELELDPEKGFHIEDVQDELAKGLDANLEMEKAAKEQHLKESEEIVDGRLEEIDDETDPADLGSVMAAAFRKRQGFDDSKLRKQQSLLKPKIRAKKQSAVWNLAKKTMEARKGTVQDDDAMDQIIDEEEWDELQN